MARRKPYTVVDLTPEPMRSALRAQGRLGLELARDWLEADELTQQDILAFFESDGPAVVDEVHEGLEGGEGWKLGHDPDGEALDMGPGGVR